MGFVFLGFDQTASTRQFRFEVIRANQPRTGVVVVADLALARQHDIQVQNLPLLCRELLAQSDDAALSAGLLTLTEARMAALSEAARLVREEKKVRKVRHGVSSNTGNAWRTAVPFTTAPHSR